MSFWRRSKVDWKEVVTQYSLELASLSGHEEIYRALLKRLADFTGAQNASILTFDFELNRYVLKAQLGSTPLSFCISSDHTLIRWLNERPQALSRTQIIANPLLKELSPLFSSYFAEWHAEWAFPLVAKKQFLGVLNLGAKEKQGGAHPSYENEELELVKALVDLGALAIENARLNEAVKKQHRHLEEMNQLKAQFLRNMSHEFRTPLHAILGSVDLMLDDAQKPLDSEQLQHAHQIQKAAQIQLNSLDHILDLTQYQSGLVQLNIKKINLKKLIFQIRQKLEPEFEKNHCEWELEWPDNTPDVYGDETEISHLLEHLIQNAVQFCSGGIISIWPSKCGEMLRVCISDTGTGIADEDQPHIFEAFRQSKDQTIRPVGGTGVGLSVAKKIVELHGGRIWVESKKDVGSQFYFTLPLTPSSLQSGGRSIETSH